MASPDPNLLAALADLEVTVTRLGHTTDRLEGELARNRDLQAQVNRLERHLDCAEERQRELHVLLLHRDQEIASLWEQLRAGRAPAPAEAAPALPPSVEPPAPEPPVPAAQPAPPRDASLGLLAAPPIDSLMAFALVRAWDGLFSVARRARSRGDRG